MPRIHHAAARGALIGGLLSFAIASGAAAQVASLATPGPSPDASPASAADEPDDPQAALLAFAQCMRDHGIDMPDPQFSADGAAMIRIGGPGTRPEFDPESEVFQAAQEACGPQLEAVRPRLDPEQQAELLEQQLALAQCIRDQGIDGFPDPDVDADGRLRRFAGAGPDDLGFDPFSETFQAAMETCTDELGIDGVFGAGPARPVSP
jgi:hypothetical protein